MSLQRTKNESGMGFLDTDFTKLAQEVKAIDEKYNGERKAQRLNVSKQTTGSMYSQKNQHRVAFLDGNSVPEPEAKATPRVEEPSMAQRLNSVFDPENRMQTGRSVRSAQSGVIQDTGGPSKYIKSETQPSIWDTDKLSRAMTQPDSRTEIRNERAANAEDRKSMRQQGLDNLTSALESVDQRRASNVAPASDQTVSDDQSRFTRVSRNISIFDTMEGNSDFENLPQRTAGEKLSEEKQAARNQEDNSWRENGGRVQTMQGSVDRLFDALLRASEKK